MTDLLSDKVRRFVTREKLPSSFCVAFSADLQSCDSDQKGAFVQWVRSDKHTNDVCDDDDDGNTRKSVNKNAQDGIKSKVLSRVPWHFLALRGFDPVGCDEYLLPWNESASESICLPRRRYIPSRLLESLLTGSDVVGKLFLDGSGGTGGSIRVGLTLFDGHFLHLFDFLVSYNIVDVGHLFHPEPEEMPPKCERKYQNQSDNKISKRMFSLSTINSAGSVVPVKKTTVSQPTSTGSVTRVWAVRSSS